MQSSTNMKTLLIGICLVVGFVSCKKKEKEVTLSGRIISTCNGDPIADATVTFYKIKSLGQKGDVAAQATTDGNGNFSITYKSDYSKMRMYVNGHKYMLDIKGYEDINFGDLYLEPISKAVVRLKVLSVPASNSNDTLYCGPYGGYYVFKCPPPVHDTVFPVAYFSTLELVEYKNLGKSKVEINWQLGIGNANAVRNNYLLNVCNSIPDTVTLTIQ